MEALCPLCRYSVCASRFTRAFYRFIVSSALPWAALQPALGVLSFCFNSGAMFLTYTLTVLITVFSAVTASPFEAVLPRAPPGPESSRCYTYEAATQAGHKISTRWHTSYTPCTIMSTKIVKKTVTPKYVLHNEPIRKSRIDNMSHLEIEQISSCLIYLIIQLTYTDQL